MNAPESSIKDELLQAFYAAIDDFRNGVLDDETFKDRLLKLAARYERNFTPKDPNLSQKDLF